VIRVDPVLPIVERPGGVPVMSLDPVRFPAMTVREKSGGDE